MKRLIYLALMASLILAACASPQAESSTGADAGGDSGVAAATEVVATAENAASVEAEDSAPTAEPQIYSDYGDLYLFSPLTSTDTYLMDADGTAVYTWTSDYSPGQAVYLLEDGSLLRTANSGSRVFDAGGQGGTVQIIAPDSTVTWEYSYSSDTVLAHHDVALLPDGNILMIAWELKTEAEAIAAGRNPSLLDDGELWPDHIVEVDPDTDQIVWEWHVWDHLIQDYDAGAANYGVVAEHPELIDLNYTTNAQAGADWTHINGIDYNAELDQILLSVHGFSEIWIIDHATTTAEAAGSAGDLLYRWGNPQAYDAGGAGDEQLYQQHNAQWIADGLPGAGNILVFNNGSRRDRAWSSVDEIVPPLNADGSYSLDAGAYGPDAATWSYSDPDNFYADHISGAQRLANGDTLIADGVNGRFFEVDSAGDVVWEYGYGGQVFRVTGIAASDPALANLDLQPGETLQGSQGPSGQGPGGQGAGEQGPGPRPGPNG